MILAFNPISTNCAGLTHVQNKRRAEWKCEKHIILATLIARQNYFFRIRDSTFVEPAVEMSRSFLKPQIFCSAAVKMSCFDCSSSSWSSKICDKNLRFRVWLRREARRFQPEVAGARIALCWR